jgi:hypothetical protein
MKVILQKDLLQFDVFSESDKWKRGTNKSNQIK